MSILSKNLKLLRKESYLSFEEIVEKIGCTEEEFIEWEEGVTEPDEYTLEKICQVLRMPYEDIRERDLSLEREAALKQMKGSASRKNYDWYFGSKTEKLFHLGYILYFVIGLSIALLVWKKMMPTDEVINKLLEYNWELTFEQLKIQIIIERLVSCLSVFVGGAGIFIIIWYFKRHTFKFSIWYIFWFSLILAVFLIISAVACIPFFVYSIIKLFPKNKKN